MEKTTNNSNENFTKKSTNNSIELLNFDKTANVYIQDNKLFVTLYKTMTNKELLKLYETLENFYDVCKKKNKRFFFVVDLSSYIVDSETYGVFKKSVKFLEKHRDFFKKHKICSICIIESSVVKVALNLILQIYTPVRPLKFFSSMKDIVYDDTL